MAGRDACPKEPYYVAERNGDWIFLLFSASLLLFVNLLL